MIWFFPKMEDFLHVEESAFSGIGKYSRSDMIFNRYFSHFHQINYIYNLNG